MSTLCGFSKNVFFGFSLILISAMTIVAASFLKDHSPMPEGAYVAFILCMIIGFVAGGMKDLFVQVFHNPLGAIKVLFLCLPVFPIVSVAIYYS